ncbi:hypothetical protein CRM81_12140 [Yersinia kristensenii]|nr:hypothetical protein CRM81_12140 [Yersinia kristensenii]
MIQSHQRPAAAQDSGMLISIAPLLYGKQMRHKMRPASQTAKPQKSCDKLTVIVWLITQW